MTCALQPKTSLENFPNQAALKSLQFPLSLAAAHTMQAPLLVQAAVLATCLHLILSNSISTGSESSIDVNHAKMDSLLFER